MKNLLLAATAAAAAMAMAPAANAVVVDGIDFSMVTNDAFSADMVMSPESFSFDLPSGKFMVDVSATATTGVSWKFTDVLFNGVSVLDFLLPNGKYIVGSFVGSSTTNTNTLTFLGTGGGSFGGSIAIAPIPEPATWAMMLVGVAAVGTAMRRRSQNVRVSFS